MDVIQKPEKKKFVVGSRIMKIFKLGWTLILAGMVMIYSISCLPTFSNPLPIPQDIKPDSMILGTWISTDKSKDGSQVSFFARKSGWIDIVYIYDINSTSSIDGINFMTFEGYTVNVNKDKYLCFRLREKDIKHGNQAVSKFTYFLTNYHISNNNIITINLFSQNSIKMLIENQKLKGEIKKGKFTEQVIVTASSEELISAIAQEGLEAFISIDETLKFRKLGKLEETRKLKEEKEGRKGTLYFSWPTLNVTPVNQYTYDDLDRLTEADYLVGGKYGRGK